MIFKNYMKIFIKNIKAVLFSFIIFMVMLIIFTSSKDNNVEFKPMKLDLMINDEDKSEESKALINYLKEKHNVKEEKITESEAKKQIVEDKIIAYIVINKDFKQNLLNNKKAISILAPTKTSYITFLKIDLKSYLNYTLSAINSNVDQQEVINTLKKEIDVKIIDTKLYNQEKGKEAFNTTFLILSYIVFMSIISIIINIDAEFKRESLLKRMALSPYSQKSQTLQQFLAQIIISILISSFYLAVSISRVNEEIPKTNLVYMSLAVFIFSFTAISLGQLLVSISKDVKVVNGVNSAFTLIMAFSSGVFLPMKFLPQGLINVSKFMPQYYFVKFLEEINFEKFLLFVASQVVFIVFYTLLGIFIKRYKLKEVA